MPLKRLSHARRIQIDDLDPIYYDLDQIDQIDHDIDQIDKIDQIDHDLDQIDKIDQIDHDLGPLDPNPNPLFSVVVRDLLRSIHIGPTQEKHAQGHADHFAPTRHRELRRSYRYR